MARRGTRRGMIKKTPTRAYRRSPAAKKKIAGLERSNKSLRARLAKARGGNPFPHGPHLKTEAEAFAFVAAGGAANGFLSAKLDAALAQAQLTIPGNIRPGWALTALLIVAPTMGWVKGANGARMALASSGMAAAQLSDYLKTV